MPRTNPAGPPAVLDICGNCVYWEEITQDRGICHVISYPAKYDNKIAFITAHGQPAHYMTQKGEQDRDISSVFVPVRHFWCPLYKVRR